MGSTCRIHTSARRALGLALLGLWLFCAGGCAMIPFALTTTASLAMPQTASLAMSGVKGAYKTMQLAADERDMNTIMRDNMLTLKAKSALLTERSATDVQVYAYTGDIFAVGVVDNEAQRDHLIRTLQGVKGVDEVKGVIRLRDMENPYAGLRDNFLENTTRMALGRYLLHKNAGVEIGAVQGELCLMGVVGTYAEALDLIQYVESVSGTRAMSLLAIRDEYATGRPENNKRYLLTPAPAAQEANETRQLAAERPQTLPSAPVIARKFRPAAAPEQPVVWNKARIRLGDKLQTLAKRAQSPSARAELMTLAGQVTTDHDLSITDRLSVAAAQAKNQHARLKIQSLLALY
ncbi:MAG: BON domain-containing protein [Proteobacteria bacterium]|nr:BON domain-containing protein [Pseudomonadota bacterium]MBU1594924.1 BON domain-containing protein [Pseudomonadota bacterium]